MSFSKRTQIAVLACVLTALAAVFYYRGFGLRFGGTPAALEGEFKTEEDWIVTEIVRDLAEMSTVARGAGAKEVHATAQLARPGVYHVAAPDVLNGNGELDLSARIWDPDPFAVLVRAMVPQAPPAQNGAATLDLHRRVTELTPQRLTAASRELSTALAAHMSDAGLHESAALTIGAFAMRESAGRFNDVRWSLNRMTAHLAMARGLAPGRPASVDGRVAEVMLLALANHQQSAMAAIEHLDASPDAAGALPWTRAIRLRLTQDWNLVADPASVTLLEKFEYLRARRSVARGARSVGDFDDLGVNPTGDAEWARILEASPRGVEEASFLARGVALGLEQNEALAVRKTFPAAADGSSDQNLNARATRCMTEGVPQVLPWGAWAESSQRHLAMLIGADDAYWRHKLGDNAAALSAAAQLDSALEHLALYAPGTTFRTKGTANGEADLSHMRAAISLVIHSPERLNVFVWEWLERASKYEALRVGMPHREGWFVRPSPRMPYDAGNRATLAGYGLSGDELLALVADAPYDYGLGLASLAGRFGEKAPLVEVQKTFARRLSYDLRAVDYALARATDDEGLELREWACQLNPTHCAALAKTLVRLNRPADAAAQYERAFADPTFDQVRLANESEWLVTYYWRGGQTARALALAERSARIGSQAGMITAAHLYENLGSFDEAEATYKTVFERYDDPAQLLGFYYRGISVRKVVAYDAAWRSLVPTTFPGGLRPAPESLEGDPQSGVIITKDNPNTIKAGIQAGDIIVGLEGFRVDDLPQYRAINTFFSRDEVKLRLWRGKLFTATFKAPNRLMGIEFRSYPIKGWAEK